ncbi:glycoside hydrolase family 30 protein [Chitinophaga sancti]|uniref:Glucosylceramidase n=1 Tax=Chitinophaga sancti TaxID=1004 RepID=A0A1K1SRJ7_9BACT|nr:glycoside hydrolase family 30 beta sandwich domain-containing protein [Chitinophaga sancti]WQD65332.1 glycoside hydrolase family 30 beta sandwich domain-containing protein [Chitinophaga sancti]WQG89044.1 glycoside hydrolase family 30 beta sandwich domain-containing protein [Chitinophaga sancti]SFW86844.1 glucosylceramidase [Chitinophaga sancti]
MRLNHLFFSLFCCFASCKGGSNDTTTIITPPPAGDLPTDVTFWLTKADKTVLLTKQKVSLLFKDTVNVFPTIKVDEGSQYQSIDGFGYCLTDGSATLINKLPSATQDALLKELFGTDSTSIGVSYLRVSIGASDLSATPYTYDDIPAGQTDVNLDHFSIGQQQSDLMQVLKRIVAISPKIKILGSPWSAPVWMKDNGSFVGGSLKPEYYATYAQYFVKYIQAMKAEGIVIDAITPQNEPLHGGNNPSMVMQATEQATFIKTALGPAFKSAGITTKIICYDHNADRPDYPAAVLQDADAKQYVDGSAFHLYGGSISNLGQLHDAFPDKNVYFTEQWVGAPGDFASNLQWHITNLIIGATRNWSRNVLEWNLASDPSYNPHTDGGCSTCMGALTISSDVTRNVAYYIIAHAAKFVKPGSIRIATNVTSQLDNVAFKTPDGKRVLIVINNAGTTQSFNIQFNGKVVTPTLTNGAVGTYIW